MNAHAAPFDEERIKMSAVLVKEYDPKWPEWFETLRARIEPALAGVPHRIEHIGSTAVPGLTAKPIIDLDIILNRSVLPPAKERLAAIGYAHQGDLGVPDREAFNLPDEELKRILPPHHLYVCIAGAAALHDHLSFRDFMRKSPEWVQRLSSHKVRLCEQGRDDRQVYMDGKAEMVREISVLAIMCF